MSLLGLAASMDVPTTSLSRLLRGQADHHVAARIGTMSFSVQAFIDGEVRLGMATALGTNTATASELRSGIDRETAIGIVIGLCAAQPRKERKRADRETADSASG